MFATRPTSLFTSTQINVDRAAEPHSPETIYRPAVPFRQQSCHHWLDMCATLHNDLKELYAPKHSSLRRAASKSVRAFPDVSFITPLLGSIIHSHPERSSSERNRLCETLAHTFLTVYPAIMKDPRAALPVACAGRLPVLTSCLCQTACLF